MNAQSAPKAKNGGRQVINFKTVAKSVIKRQDGKILLLKRSATDPRRPGEWDYPGGLIEEGEDCKEGAVREIAEECGLKLNAGDLKILYSATEYWEPGNESVTRLLMFAKVNDSNVVLSYEHDEYQWVDSEQAVLLFPHFFYAKGLQYALGHNLID